MMSNVKVRDTKKENMFITMVLWGILAFVAMAAMLYVTSRKTIVITDSVLDSRDMVGNEYVMGASELILQQKPTDERHICIPLEKGIKAENVVMENRYMERELWIYLQGADKDFYVENSIYGDLTPVQSGYYEVQRSNVVLKLRMDGVLEYRSTMENNVLEIAYYNPDEIYEKIIVVDPMGGGSEYGVRVGSSSEKKIALQVVKQLQKKSEPENTKIYYTRLEDVEVSYEERLALVEAVDADLFVGIRACEDSEHTDYYGIHGFYNGEYFIPEYGNIQWADILTRNVTVAASNKAVGLTPAKEGSILYDIDIPAAEICVGYLSNGNERALLEQESYQDKLAQGLLNAVKEFFAIQNTENEVEN